jgi:hypothetical protein
MYVILLNMLGAVTYIHAVMFRSIDLNKSWRFIDKGEFNRVLSKEAIFKFTL